MALQVFVMELDAIDNGIEMYDGIARYKYACWIRHTRRCGARGSVACGPEVCCCVVQAAHGPRLSRQCAEPRME